MPGSVFPLVVSDAPHQEASHHRCYHLHLGASSKKSMSADHHCQRTRQASRVAGLPGGGGGGADGLPGLGGGGTGGAALGAALGVPAAATGAGRGSSLGVAMTSLMLARSWCTEASM